MKLFVNFEKFDDDKFENDENEHKNKKYMT